MRVAMHEKRLNKASLMVGDFLEPKVSGSPLNKDLVLSWGSTYGVIEEALSTHPEWKKTHLHFTQVYPLPESLGTLLDQADSITVIENNATGQFASLIQQTYGIKVDRRILKYNGEPYHIDELVTRLEEQA